MNWMQKLWNLVAPAPLRFTGPLAARGGGMLVNTDTALGLSTVWGCVNAITGAIAPLEWCEMQTQPDGTNKEVRTNVNWLLNKQANPEMTAFSWRELAIVQVLLVGNHYSEIERDNMGRPIWLWPLRPEYVQPDRDVDGKLVYRVWGSTGGETILSSANVIHIKGLGWDGLVGHSVISMARRTIGAALAMDEYWSKFYENGTHLGLIFEHPRKLTPDAKSLFEKSLTERFTGPQKAFRAMVTEEGMKLSKATMTMVDAQFNESRRSMATDICKWFRVPPHKVAELDRSTNNNIEHQSIEFVQDAVAPMCRRLEQECDIKLYGRTAQRSMYTKLDTDPLLRGDLLSRYTAYEKGRNGGFLSADDIREMEDRNPLPDGNGDIYLQPLNFVEAGTQPEPVATADPNAAPTNVIPISQAYPIGTKSLEWARKQKEQRNG